MMSSRSLFAGNLGTQVTEDERYEQFSYFGRVRFLKFIKGNGIAFVRMAREEDEYNAKLGLNGIELHSHQIRVEEAKPKK